MSLPETIKPPGRHTLLYIYFAVILSGAAVMVVELLGGKLLAPYYGSGIYAWTSIISVTLLALSLGYLIAGKMVAKISTILPIAMVLTLSGLSILLLHKIFPAVADHTRALDLRWASLLSSMVLIFPPLVMLGTVSLLASKIICRDVRQYGSSVGKVFALSTISGIAGALLAGFYLAPWLGSDRSLFILSWVLMVAGAAGMVMKKSLFYSVLGLAALGLALLISVLNSSGNGFLQEYRVLEQKESRYGEILVLEDDTKKYLFVDRILQTEESKLIDLFWRKGMSLAAGNYFEMVPYIRPKGRRVLVIGLGGGHLAKLFSRYGWEVDAVELDPVVAGIAKTHFGYQGEVHIDDGRYFLQGANDEQWNCIILDVFLGDAVPTHLYTVEMFQLCRRRLVRKGILALNYIGILDSALTGHLVHTLKTVFPEVAVYPQDKHADKAQIINIFAGGDGSEFPEQITMQDGTVVPLEKADHSPVFDGMPVILSDRKNPIDLLRHETALLWRNMSRERFML
jgi:spermidine synthase